MRIIETEVYEFHELSEQAKENAKIELVSEYFWSDDAIASLYAFAEEIGIKIIDYSIDWSCSAISHVKWEWYLDQHENDLSVEELTGYCMDYELIDEWNKTKDVDDAINQLLYACERDYEYQHTDEYMIEHCEANGYEFTKEGTLI